MFKSLLSRWRWRTARSSSTTRCSRPTALIANWVAAGADQQRPTPVLLPQTFTTTRAHSHCPNSDRNSLKHFQRRIAMRHKYVHGMLVCICACLLGLSALERFP
jgi:hypothetical protein